MNNQKYLFRFLKRFGFRCVKEPVIGLDYSKRYMVKLDNMRGGFNVITINFDNITDEDIYAAFSVNGNESEALNDIYLELFELLGKEAMLRIYKHYHGDKINLPMRLYRPEFIADLAKQEPDRRERAKIARAGGYSAKMIEGLLSKRKREGEESE